MAQRRFDVVMAWSIGLADLALLLRDLHAAGCDLYLHQQGIHTTTPAGRAMFQMMGVFTELERALMQERVKAGMARAKVQGKHVGRSRITGDKGEALLLALRAGDSLRAAARKVGIGVATASRIRDATTP